MSPEKKRGRNVARPAASDFDTDFYMDDEPDLVFEHERIDYGGPTAPLPAPRPKRPDDGKTERGVQATLASLGLLLVIAGAGLLYLRATTGVPFFTKGEPREALVVQTIHQTGEWILPLRNGDEIPSKPPLFHWLGAIAASAAGAANEQAVRVPSVLAALLALLATALYAIRRRDLLSALFATVVLTTNQQWLASATTARVDMVLAGSVTLALVAFGLGRGGGRAAFTPLFWIAAAFAVLAKGPVGLVLPVAVAAAYLGSIGDWRSLFRPGLPAIVFALALPAAWYTAAYLQGGQPFVDKLLLDENLHRVVDAESSGMGHVRPWYFYFPLLLGGFAPWSFFIPLAAADAWNRRDELDRTGLLLPLIWLAATFVLFSLADSKRSVYLLSAYPAAALLLGAWWADLVRGRTSLGPLGARCLRWLCWSLAALFAIVAGTLTIEALGTDALQRFATLVSSSDRANLAVVAELVGDQPSFSLAVAAVLSVGVLGLILAAANERWAVAFTFLSGLVATAALLGAAVFLPGIARTQSLDAFMRTVVAETVPDDGQVFFYPQLDYGAVFYFGRPIGLLETTEQLATIVGAAEPQSGELVGSVWLLTWERWLDDLAVTPTGLDGADAGPATGRPTVHFREVTRHGKGGYVTRAPLVLLRLVRDEEHAASGGS